MHVQRHAAELDKMKQTTTQEFTCSLKNVAFKDLTVPLKLCNIHHTPALAALCRPLT